jgi:hypothetical protein
MPVNEVTSDVRPPAEAKRAVADYLVSEAVPRVRTSLHEWSEARTATQRLRGAADLIDALSDAFAALTGTPAPEGCAKVADDLRREGRRLDGLTAALSDVASRLGAPRR